jgi:hypothetical protein
VSTKYAVKTPFEDGLLFVTEGDSKFQLRIKTFETAEDARDFASHFGDGCVVVELDDDYELLL